MCLLVANASKKFDVVNVTQAMIKDYRNAMDDYFKKTVRNKNGPFKISKYKRFTYNGREITVAEDQNISASQSFNALKKGVDPKSFDYQTVLKLYEDPIPLNKKKLENIFNLRKYIPPAYQEWYENLSSNSNITLDLCEDSDFKDIEAD
ncbi:hypothetical protein ABEB36_012758 [Hypothenemus hampei]|uniref:Uncharacterized protein n=1 Tax=Hypothenemus hampei TaxID=57062 RepID=A0ABD1ECF5_HYPHA